MHIDILPLPRGPRRGASERLREELQALAGGHAEFLAEVGTLRAELAAADEFRPGVAVAAAWAALREAIPFMPRDRAMDGDVATALRLVREGRLLTAARAALDTP